ncbi:MAG: hypothetical protein K2V38_18395 [Gemmataceae bacterium]|nr:hypothetical protein [Gemmataceae bacterium]
MDAVVERFIAHSPMAVAVRGAFECALDAAHLDEQVVEFVGRRDALRADALADRA